MFDDTFSGLIALAFFRLGYFVRGLVARRRKNRRTPPDPDRGA
jgi:hypothetical protein